MKKTLVVIASAGAVAGGLLLSMLVVPHLVQDPHAKSAVPRSGKAHWADHYNSLEQMMADVDAIVLARHVAGMPGRVEDSPEDPLPFTNNRFLTIRAVKGNVGSSFIVEQTGGDLAGVEYSIDDGGPYAPGDHYLLFLKRQPDTGYFYLVNPQGRFHNEGGRLKAVVRDAVTARLHGKAEEEALGVLARAGR